MWLYLETGPLQRWLKLGLNPGAIWMVSFKEKIRTWTTQVIQWLGNYLAMQGPWFDHWSRKILHALGQSSLWATTTAPTWPSAPALKWKKPLQQEAHVPQLQSNPWSLQLEKTHSQQRRSSTTKSKQIFLMIFLKEKLGYMTPEIQRHKEKVTWGHRETVTIHKPRREASDET